MENIAYEQRAQLLSQAMPYIQQLIGKTFVIKYGGNAMVSEESKASMMEDIVQLSSIGVNVVVIHGGGPEISTLLARMGKESVFVGGLRHTDEETMEVVQMALAGKLNKELVQKVELHGGRAIGLSGLDGGMIKAKKYMREDLGQVGEIISIDASAIQHIINGGYIPVIAPIGGSDDGSVYNINADTAAARIAAELKAEKLLLISNVRGLLRDKDDEDSLIPVVNVCEIPGLKRMGVISGGMIPKIDCCIEAIELGVPSTHIIDGRIPHSVLIELLLDEGVGTMIL